jgi:hypothetical protein
LIKSSHCCVHHSLSIIRRRKKEEGRRKKEKRRRKREEGRGKKEEGRRKKEEGRRKKEEGRRYILSYVLSTQSTLIIVGAGSPIYMIQTIDLVNPPRPGDKPINIILLLFL